MFTDDTEFPFFVTIAVSKDNRSSVNLFGSIPSMIPLLDTMLPATQQAIARRAMNVAFMAIKQGGRKQSSHYSGLEI